MTEIKITKTKLTAGIFILLMAIGTTYYVTIDDPVYFCEDRNLVGICFKLSKVNDLGTQTRCYYNESTPTRYKNCKTGWVEYKQTEFIGNQENYSGIELDLNSSLDKITALKTLGIGKFEVKNQSCKTWNYSETSFCDLWNYSEIQGNCISWDNETNSSCLEYETMQIKENCLENKTIFTKENCLQIDNGVLSYNEPIISPCIKISDLSCRSKIYQKGGINKDLIIFFENYSQTEIENLLVSKTNTLLDNIANVQIQRNKLEQEIFLTGEIRLNI